ncbi:MAG: radical SAM protein, partial [Erysipelotrichaceae bacterium]|nr:radical SAM protein [Erysipelotrichaceae bacterium]
CVVVSNGCMNPALFKEVAAHIDAINIDLKGFTQEFYDRVRGDLESVKENIVTAHRHCHLEVTTLVVPGWNDSLEQMDQQARWLASVDPNIPLHLTRCFPRYQMQQAESTPVKTLQDLSKVAKQHLRYVFLGNC